MLLETFDFLSLLTCFGVDSQGCGPVPTFEGRWEQLSVRRLSDWEVALTPFPFPGDRLAVEIECIHLRAASFQSDEELRAQVSSARPETRRTLYSSA